MLWLRNRKIPETHKLVRLAWIMTNVCLWQGGRQGLTPVMALCFPHAGNGMNVSILTQKCTHIYRTSYIQTRVSHIHTWTQSETGNEAQQKSTCSACLNNCSIHNTSKKKILLMVHVICNPMTWKVKVRHCTAGARLASSRPACDDVLKTNSFILFYCGL